MPLSLYFYLTISFDTLGILENFDLSKHLLDGYSFCIYEIKLITTEILEHWSDTFVFVSVIIIVYIMFKIF